MEQAFSRTELLLGSSALERLAASRVAVFGIGGVGGYVCEALARTGVGHLDLIDSDTVAVSNINRQIIATTKTVGQYKTDAMEARILDINPAAKITKHNCFFLPETAADFPFNQYDYVVDAVDTMSAKLALVTHCHAARRAHHLRHGRPGISWTPPAFRWRTWLKRKWIRWPGSCAGS